MSSNADNFVLVAPRPVRLAAPTAAPPFSPFQGALNRPQTRMAGMRLVADGVDRLKLGDDVFQTQDDIMKPTEPAEREPVSPRASPRSAPSEALEEFLSILQSSSFYFPPTSPILRASNGSAAHTFFYRASSSLSTSHQEGLGVSLSDAADEMRRDSATPAYPFKLIGSGSLASPVSRTHTRNPFQRHPSYENAFAGILRPLSASPGPLSPGSPAIVSMSPAAVPLPLPTPDELEATS
ncbi:uncharacterized protein B0H18DRAFT_978366 [Fomitopsis serialis]|uniref:uncharacterized protein n=1 Tax=Fomitopsis serialis TaxID=139415 RepID=UPI002007F546|nr:uncharacterized protein B0H18DRAFT_978366 [Neoantrodia serialis]KAH9934806.1 hypothetical protein B0H18DRAFT_978366 [Neoantrodia serialis]